VESPEPINMVACSAGHSGYEHGNWGLNGFGTGHGMIVRKPDDLTVYADLCGWAESIRVSKAGMGRRGKDRHFPGAVLFPEKNVFDRAGHLSEHRFPIN